MGDKKEFRLENLASVLRARGVLDRERASYLAARLGSGGSYWSGLLTGSRHFGEKVARRIEVGLGLPDGNLDADPKLGQPLPPDAKTIAFAFASLPCSTEAELAHRERVYIRIMAFIDGAREASASAHVPAPAAPPNGAHPRVR